MDGRCFLDGRFDESSVFLRDGLGFIPVGHEIHNALFGGRDYTGSTGTAWRRRVGGRQLVRRVMEELMHFRLEGFVTRESTGGFARVVDHGFDNALDDFGSMVCDRVGNALLDLGGSDAYRACFGGALE